MTDGTQSNTALQRDYSELKPYQFKPGQSGNSSGKPKGAVSLKSFAKKYIRNLSDEEKLEFIAWLDKLDIWKMAEGNAHNTQDITTDGEALQPVLVKFIDGTKDNWNTSWV